MKIWHFVVCFDSPVVGAWSAAPEEKLINNKCQKEEVQIKNWITILSIVFLKNDKNKCDLKWNDEEVLLQRFTLPFNYESSYLVIIGCAWFATLRHFLQVTISIGGNLVWICRQIFQRSKLCFLVKSLDILMKVA